MVSEKSILIAAVLVFVGFVAVSVVFEDFGVTTDDERIRDGCLNGHGAAVTHDHVYLDIWIADENGDLHDQIETLIKNLKKNPNSRRHIISAWNVPHIENMALPPCHTIFQFYVNDNKLSCQLYQRSADVFLGVPFNIASYSLLTMMIAQVCNFKLGDFIHTFGDAHIYLNHIDQVNLQLKRDFYPLPKMKINPDVNDIFSFEYEDFELLDYKSHPHIKGQVSV